MRFQKGVFYLTFAVLTGGVARAQERGGQIHELTVRATEFEFEANDTVPAGMVRIRLDNRGQMPHHLQLLRLDEGRTMQDVLDHAERDELVVPGVRFVGGPAIPPENGSSEVLVELEAGRYLMVCYMPAGKVRHLSMGMVRQLTVIPSADRAPEVREDARLGLDSYGFQLEGDLKPGRRVIRVENLVTEPHEVDIVRLLPGKTAADLQAWLGNPRLPLPFKAAGGSMVLDRGEVSYVTLGLERGDYALVCFVPDTRDHRPHAAHGMVRVVTVDP